MSILALVRHTFKFTRVYAIALFFAVFLMTVDILFSFGNAWIQNVFVDMIGQNLLQELMYLIKLCLAIGAACLVFMMIQFLLKNIFNSFIARDFSLFYFEQFNKIPLLETNKYASGDLVNRINKDAPVASNILNIIIFDILFNLLLCAVVFIYLAKINLPLALIALFGGPLIFLIGKLFDFRLRKIAVHIQEKDAEVRSYLQEVVQGIRTLKTLSLGKKTHEKYDALRNEQNRLLLRQNLLQSGMAQSIDFTFNAVAYTCAFFIGVAAIRGELSPGQVLAFLFLTMRLMGPFFMIAQLWTQIQTSLGAADRVFEVASVEQNKKADNSEEPLELHKSVESNVALRIIEGQFSYQEGKPLFENLNLSINKGSSVAIVGQSGSGKSTLAKIYAGLYPLQRGYLEVLGELTHESDTVERNITYVPQSSYLFSGTVKENIEMGSSIEVSEAELDQASRLAGVTEFIADLPDGYQTPMKEKGSSLSGGQRQRIALARALLRDTPIIVLDEITSGLDNESQELVHNSLISLLETGKTIVFITHDMSLAKQADRIIVMDHGEIVEDGRHDDLLRLNGTYADLYHNIQSEGYH